ncbi:DUF922 domain-containing protein [Flavobacteriaceae bacterium TP-CH-4]|uniref:DUF922 domain-containing protein n=1 Tax=Pelagihabitans pacificus TaxID=2696054 RepID=A0A967AY93_9FLAO|nr:DUF922 domain-containing protein [Pelagihabitans pacificus]NHF61330.1 DUF922 domain-containing protein [Pelagihabitans pacificus]
MQLTQVQGPKKVVFLGIRSYIIIGLLVVCSAFVHPVQEETIAWTPNTRLNWNNFKGRPSNSRAAAVTASGISYTFSSMINGDDVQLDFRVSAHFYPDQSWYQPALCDSVILGHEQLHFDISELYARKMRKRLAETKFTKNVKAEIKAIYREITKELNDFQNHYDEETNFSRNREQQFEWNDKIGAALGRK